VDNTELDKVSSRDYGVVSTVAEIEGRTTSWRRMIVALMTMGSTVYIIDRDGEQNEKGLVYYASRL
jgi:hypothetical protein